MEHPTRDSDKVGGTASQPVTSNGDTGSRPQHSQTGGTMGPATEMKDQVGEQARSAAASASASAQELARQVGEQARSAAASTSATAQDLARRAREQSSAATDKLYQQGARAGEYMTRNVHEYPVAALLIAAAIGYGMAYLVHGSAWSRREDRHND